MIVKENIKSIIEVHKTAPDVEISFRVTVKKFNPFYENDSAMNQLVGGYQEGPKNSYAKDLAEKYFLNDD